MTSNSSHVSSTYKSSAKLNQFTVVQNRSQETAILLSLHGVKKQPPMKIAKPQDEGQERRQSIVVSGYYQSLKACTIHILHSALVGPENEWEFEVKCRKVKETEEKAETSGDWYPITQVCPDASVLLKHNDIEVTLPHPCENLLFAAFGTPGENDKKRMQMVIFGGKPLTGRNWKILAHLIDDNLVSFQQLCKREEARGRKLLTTLAGLLVSNIDRDITITLTGLESGWGIMGSSVKRIRSIDAWNAHAGKPAEFPRCAFEFTHVDKTKKSFFVRITASHETDEAQAEVVAYFEEESDHSKDLVPNHPKHVTKWRLRDVQKVAKEYVADQVDKPERKKIQPVSSHERNSLTDKESKKHVLNVVLFLAMQAITSPLSFSVGQSCAKLKMQMHQEEILMTRKKNKSNLASL